MDRNELNAYLGTTWVPKGVKNAVSWRVEEVVPKSSESKHDLVLIRKEVRDSRPDYMRPCKSVKVRRLIRDYEQVKPLD